MIIIIIIYINNKKCEKNVKKCPKTVFIDGEWVWFRVWSEIPLYFFFFWGQP